ncbi:MAG: hypothetical protein HKN76_15805, partial [Saprospiraceae bacterium]|nr:hypothetical protein [Saprospiraceae bacterium]
MAKNISEKESRATPFSQTYFHGTRADFKIGDLIKVGINSNFRQKKKAKYIYLTATLDAAIWGAELASYRWDNEGDAYVTLRLKTGIV